MTKTKNDATTYGSLPCSSVSSETATPSSPSSSAANADKSARSPPPSRLRVSLTARPILGIVALLGAAILLSLPKYLPTGRDFSLARDYEERAPILGPARISWAQRMADNSLKAIPDLSTGDVYSERINHKVRGNDNDNKDPTSPTNLPAVGCEATVVIVRHCEKGNVREHCSHVGFERSVYLASLFGDGDERWPAPAYIYAEAPGGRNNKRKMNFREVETVGPLSEKAGVPVNAEYTTLTVNKLAKTIVRHLQVGDLCGKLVVISWKHSNIGHMARRLGCGPIQGCPIDYKGRTFDMAWQLKYVYGEVEYSHRKDLTPPSDPQWTVYGSVQPEGFDPLAFSKLVGDYDAASGSTGDDDVEKISQEFASWKKHVVRIPERKSVEDKETWANAKKALLRGK